LWKCFGRGRRAEAEETDHALDVDEKKLVWLQPMRNEDVSLRVHLGLKRSTLEPIERLTGRSRRPRGQRTGLQRDSGSRTPNFLRET
jgi:hypothetical protein